MGFKDDLSSLISQPAHSEPSGKASYVEQFAPHDPNTRTVQATSSVRLETEDDWSKFVEERGGAIPAGYRVRLVEMRHNSHGWTRSAHGEDATTTGTWFYRFIVEPVNIHKNFDDLISLINKRKPVKPQTCDGDVFHFLAGDLQLGKIDGDSTEGIVNCYLESVERAQQTFKQLRRTKPIAIAHLAFLGDCGEGNQSQGGRNMWRTELTITEQYRLFRRLMLATVDAFRTIAPEIHVDVVNGNHDDVQRFQNTRADDGHATESAIALSDQLAMNPDGYGHVKVFVPNKDESYLTREIGSSVFTMAHGHQWSRGKSAEWWKGQSWNRHAPHASQFLLHGHEHEFSIKSARERVQICVPTFESESTWWRHKTGDLAIRGAVVMTTNSGSFADLAIV